MKINLKRNFDWSLLPEKVSIDRSKVDNSKVYENSFRWIRKNRIKELCFSWKTGNELGWYLHSPVDVSMDQINEVELSLDSAELENLNNSFELKNLWQREKSYIATSNDWINLYQFKKKDGNWDSMFIPNGDGFLEWKLGFSIKIPDGYSLLICPLEDVSDFTISFGLLTEKHLKKMNLNGGLSIAIKPRTNVSISRGEKIARIILIENKTILAKEELEN